MQETLRVLDDFVRAGKIRYIGVSNWDGWHVVKTNTYAKFLGLTPLISNQIQYNLADRAADKLKIVARVSAGYDNIDLSAASKHGVWVTNTPGATSHAVADFTLGRPTTQKRP